MYKRNIENDLIEALQDTPVLLVNGARQVGKSTLVKMQLSKEHHYFTLDDPTTLASVKYDPLSFLEALPGPSVIDEVQRVPELFLPLKKIVDEKRMPGFFVLTGSANVLSLPKISDSLAGRMEIHTLWPLSQGEIRGYKEDFIATLFDGKLPSVKTKLSSNELIEMILNGGYPEVIGRSSFERQKKWFSSYLTTILEKDIRDLAQIEGLVELPRLLQIFASRCGNLVNLSEVSRSAGIAGTTLKRYLALLEKTYLLVFVPAWSKNLGKRMVKASKAYLNDTGLLTHLIDFNKERLLADKTFLGHVLENFVVMELKKQMTWSKQLCSIFHYRTHTGQEIDIILEAPNSRVVALEVKLTKTVTQKDFLNIENFEKDIGKDFQTGVVLYLGSEVLSFGKNKYAVPLQVLWT